MVRKCGNAKLKRKAFSLVELSIVLVILGLLVGGILSGQSLIRASELRSITTEFQRYITAINTFRDKYFVMPGDWSDPVNASDKSGGSGYGNQNNIVANAATPGFNEITVFWGQLSRAGIIEGSFTNAANTTLTAGTNNARGKIGNGAWNIGYLGDMAADGTNGGVSGATSPNAATFYASSYGHVLLFGGGTNALLPTGILKSEEAWNIDTKVDDGKPDRGALLTLESQGNAVAASGCGNQDGDAAAIAASDYDLSNASRTACALVFKTGN